ncbi:unnamed protein product [Paramecium primaurelia]|uniref:Uncharacterized protein n=1 Tax=Paramecium primaurelia TaxID=5886 RepID=A0A8S1QXZ0_PARPR|nr:unnamed protein product [Paramecium primaurelia]
MSKRIKALIKRDDNCLVLLLIKINRLYQLDVVRTLKYFKINKGN